MLPDFAQPLLPVPLAQLATTAGQISVLYVHIVPLLVCVGWAIGQGTDATSGEIARGTMEHLAALPVRRASLLLVPGVVAAAGAVLLAGSLWLGNWLGLATINFPHRPPAAQFLPGAANLAAMVFAFTGMAALVSVWHADRWRAIKLAGGVFVLSSILTITARAWPAAAWLDDLSFLSRLPTAETDPGRRAGRRTFAALRRHAAAGGRGLLRPGSGHLHSPRFARGDVKRKPCRRCRRRRSPLRATHWPIARSGRKRAAPKSCACT